MRLQLLSIVFVLFFFPILGESNDSIPDVKLGSVLFNAKSVKLTKNAKLVLAGLVEKIQSNPTLNIQIIAYNKDLCDKCGVLSWKRSERIVEYLEKKGIEGKRFAYTNRLDGNFNEVDVWLTTNQFKDIGHPAILRRK